MHILPGEAAQRCIWSRDVQVCLAELGFRQYLADLVGGERGDCVQIILNSCHLLPIANQWYEVASAARTLPPTSLSLAARPKVSAP